MLARARLLRLTAPLLHRPLTNQLSPSRTNSTRLLPHKPFTPPPNTSTTATPYLLLPLLATFLSPPSQSDSLPPPPPSPPPPPTTTHTWPSLIRHLRQFQQRNRLPLSFVATRRPRTLSDDDSEWAFHLEFQVSPAADLYNVLVTLAAAFQTASHGADNPVFNVQQSPTCTVLTIAEEDHFEIAVSVPRLPPSPAFQTRVVVELTKSEGPDATFSTEEVEALIRTLYLSQSPTNGLSAHVPMPGGSLLDGKDSVDIGPPTVIDRSKSHSNNRSHNSKHPSTELEYGVEPLPRAGRGAELTAKRARAKLEELGVDVFDGKDSTLSWDALAGYHDVKERIENTLTLPLKHPDVYENIVRGTRKRFESNLPKAVLYEGPPGCGKTLSAKILSVSIGVPFVHVPLETILSKFYGETTRKLAEILQTANDLGPCLVFIDECDSIGLSRSSSTEVHEVTRRTLSVLLRHIDGLDGPQNTILLAATNHKEDIDPALMSRFDVVVSFPLPDLDTRAAVLALYAKHLSKEELTTMAELSAGFSGRELLDVCEEAERTYAGYIVREAVPKGGTEQLPTLTEYVEAIKRKAPHVVGRTHHMHSPRSRDEPTGQAMRVGPSPTLAT